MTPRDAHGIIPFLHGLDPLLLIPESLARLNPYIALIGVTSVVIMVAWPRLKAIARFVPAPLVAATAGVVLGILFDVGREGTYLFMGREYPSRTLIGSPRGSPSHGGPGWLCYSPWPSEYPRSPSKV